MTHSLPRGSADNHYFAIYPCYHGSRGGILGWEAARAAITSHTVRIRTNPPVPRTCCRLPYPHECRATKSLTGIAIIRQAGTRAGYPE